MTSRLLSLVRRQPIALFALFVALGGTSYAAVGNAGPRGHGSPDRATIHGCVGDNTGRLRIVDSPARCGSLETAISFDREGRRGPRGHTGRRGATGATGAIGATGATGATGAKGADSTARGPRGATGPAGANGRDGQNGANGQDGADGLAALTATAAEPAGPNCTNGGVELTVGIDADRDHVLDAGEVDPAGTRYVCDGRDGADGATETGASILGKLGAVDGTGSGLDADTVDGRHASDLVATTSFNGLFNAQFNAAFGSAFDDRLGTLFGAADDATTVNGNGGSDGEFLGNVYLTANDFPPPGTAFAAGQALSIAQNSALFSLLGTRYGGNGQTTFNLPDLRKQAPGGLHYVIVMQGIFPTRPS